MFNFFLQQKKKIFSLLHFFIPFSFVNFFSEYLYYLRTSTLIHYFEPEIYNITTEIKLKIASNNYWFFFLVEKCIFNNCLKL